MRGWILYFVPLLCFVTVACSIDNAGNPTEGAQNDPIVSETQAGEFILRLVSDKGIYTKDEAVHITSKIKYVGELEEVTIYHAMYPFWHHIRETTRNIDIPSTMEDPLVETVLKKGVWYEKDYLKSGGYSPEEPDADFIMAFLEGESFPEGEYEIELNTDFYTGSEDDLKEEHKYSTSITIQVIN